jgi:hypothetical protein
VNDADINFCFDPLCPFAGMASKWVRQVAAQREAGASTNRTANTLRGEQ